MRDSLTKKTKVGKDRSTMFCEDTIFIILDKGEQGQRRISRYDEGFFLNLKPEKMIGISFEQFFKLVLKSW